MPSTVAADAPTVQLSFANNFWGKDDAGVTPMLERVNGAKVTADELKSFYTSRAAIEDEYARKLLGLARKPLGSCESGTLRISLDVVRGEVDAMGKAHQNIAQQMKTEMDESLAAFAGALKERRKIVQGGIEKLLKVKTQQTNTVNKARDRFEQDCLKIKGYLAQGHMVMGQEERKNKAKLEKTQIQLSASSNEYEAAVKLLEETTGRWNRDWKAACDKFQDLEEERLDFMKSSLWSFANIASTVCVSDDASCEKIRLSLEDCEVEKDILSFIKDAGTGQEIPDAPKFINFCKDDYDTLSEASNDENYAVAQFPRNTNPAFRTSSPQPPVDVHHDDDDYDMDTSELSQVSRRSESHQVTPRGVPQARSQPQMRPHPGQSTRAQDFAQLSRNDYPMDHAAHFGAQSDLSSAISDIRPSSRGSHSDYSAPTDLSSQAPSLGSASPVKQMSDLGTQDRSGEDTSKKSGFFQKGNLFRRKSNRENDRSNGQSQVIGANAYGHASTGNLHQAPPGYNGHSRVGSGEANRYQEPAAPQGDFQMSVGNNVFNVANPEPQTRPMQRGQGPDPIAQALAELKGGPSKQSSIRMSADRYHNIGSPGGASSVSSSNDTVRARASHLPDRTRMNVQQDAPPPSYNPPVSRLGAPQPAFTSKQMKQTTQRFVDQKTNMFNPPPAQPAYERSQQPSPRMQQPRSSVQASPHSRATSPAPFRSTSPHPDMYEGRQSGLPRAASPNPYLQNNGNAPPNSRPRAQSTSPIKPRQDHVPNGYQGHYQGPPGHISRSASPQPHAQGQVRRSNGDRERPVSYAGDMSMQIAQPNPPSAYQQQTSRGRPGTSGSQWGGSQHGSPGGPSDARTRSKSMSDGRQFTRDGRPILHFARAMYMYQAAIPEELSFTKGDVLAVLRLQDDGWWEAEVVGKRSRPGLVPSNYLVNC